MNKGFTLTEVLISTFVFGIIVSILFGFLGPTNRASNKARIESELGNLSQLALVRFAREAQGASELGTSDGQTVSLKLPKYATSGDLLSGQFDTVSFRVDNGRLLFVQGATEQLLLRGLADETVFRYYDSQLNETDPANARMVRISLHAVEPYGGTLLHVRQSRDIRLRNAR